MKNWKDLIEKYAVPLLLVLGVVVFFIWKQLSPQTDLPQAQASRPRVSETTPTSIAETRTETGRIMVDVKGAVKKPGVYELSGSARVQQAVERAGGLTSEADPNGLNLAQVLKDEAVVYVPHQGEVAPSSQVAATGSGGTAGGVAAGQQDSGKIALNQATAEDLQKIPGIGKKRAEDILAYRDQHGSFKSVDDLKQVSGIGDKTLEKIKDHVAVD